MDKKVSEIVIYFTRTIKGNDPNNQTFKYFRLGKENASKDVKVVSLDKDSVDP